jgi:hypothetical protein
MRIHTDADVEEASEESFPASDAPAWIEGSATPEATPPHRTNIARVVREGVIAGLLGYAAVVVVVAAMDLVRGRSPFHTAAVLGSWLFYGLEAASRSSIEPGPVLAYNGVHLLVSLAVGTVAALLVLESGLFRGFWYFALMILIAAVMYPLVVLGGIAVEWGQMLDWTTVLVGTAAWLAAMTTYFWRCHGDVVRKIRSDMEADS